MSVDLAVFEQIKELSHYGERLHEMIYQMCEGDFRPHFNIISSVDYPTRNTATFEQEKAKFVAARRIVNDRRADQMKQFEYEHISQDGGGEGGSEECHGVFTVYGKIYKAEYSYYSHSGHDTDEILSTLREVKPVQKTITVYE